MEDGEEVGEGFAGAGFGLDEGVGGGGEEELGDGGFLDGCWGGEGEGLQEVG